MTAKTSSPGDVYSRLIARDVVFTIFRGYLTADMTKRAAAEFERMIRHTARHTWLIDILDLADFEAKAVVVGNSWWSEFRKHHGRRVVLVSLAPSYSMVASTLGFATGTPVTTFATLDAACHHLGIPLDADSGVIARAALIGTAPVPFSTQSSATRR